jgi:hypothetical protein
MIGTKLLVLFIISILTGVFIVIFIDNIIEMFL